MNDFSDLENRFTYHAPTERQAQLYEELRDRSYLLALLMVENAPFSRELSLAVTKIEEAVFWCNAAIARHEGQDDE
jgi:hypothetical protein